MRTLVFLILCSVVLAAASCKTQNKIVYNYLEDMSDTTTKESYYLREPVIQKQDQLSIQIYSASLDPQTDALYNQPVQPTTYLNAQALGYLVDQNGNVELPRIGTIRAAGLTKTQLADTIKSRLLQGQLKDPSVIIRFLNFRISVIGEVGAPGVKTIAVENLTILEALALSGDITLYGKKKEVKVLRENNGKRQLGIIDVTSKNMFRSPYYQLQQNDIVMVEQSKYKIRTTEQGRISQQLGFALSIITSVALLYNIFLKK